MPGSHETLSERMPVRSRSRWRKTLLVAAAIALAIVAFIAWYRIQYSMGVAQAFEVNDPNSPARVLIATQGSTFKDAVRSGVVDHLSKRPAYVKVIDVSALPSVNEDEWSAIVVMHTWEMREPQANAKAFVDGARNRHKIVVMSTSGDGSQKLEGVDAISAASSIADVPSRVAQITGKVDAILDAAVP